jgi:hypothetical protein
MRRQVAFDRLLVRLFAEGGPPWRMKDLIDLVLLLDSTALETGGADHHGGIVMTPACTERVVRRGWLDGQSGNLGLRHGHVASQPDLQGPVALSVRLSGKSSPDGNTQPRTDTLFTYDLLSATLQNKGFFHILTQGAKPRHKGENGSGGWDRTNDLVINSHPLFR